MTTSTTTAFSPAFEQFDSSSSSSSSSRVCPAWVCEHASTTEGMTFYLSLSDGSFAFVQVVYSTMGWSPSTQMTGRYYAADGKSYCKTMNSTGTAFKLSEDRHSVSCEEVSIKLLDATSLTYKVTFSAPPTLTLSFTFKATVPLFQAIDNSFPSRPSKILFNKDVDADGGVHAQFIPKAEVFEGLAILDGRAVDISGSGMLVYALQNKPQCAKYWNFVNFQNETDAITMYEFYLPAGYKREHYSTGSLVLDNKLVMMSFDNKGVHEECQVDSFSGYHIPQRIKYVWQGTTIPSSSSSSNTTTESSLLIKKEEASSTTAPAAETSTMTLATPAAVDESSTEALAASIESINISNNNITLEEEKPQSCRVELVVECQRLCDKIDVLGQLPYLLRKFIQTFITAPFVYQWYEEAEATITFGSNGERRVIKGNVFFETTHLQH